MPYRSPDKRRLYDRERKRLTRVGCPTPRPTVVIAGLRLQTARDVLRLIEEQVLAVREDAEISTLERARCVGFLAGVALRAVEAADLTARVEAVEATLKQRRHDDARP